jgi:Rho GDP-dissociation inhibitor
MSEKVSTQEVVDDEDVINYKPPPEKTLEEIINADKEDESLKKYKEALLGNATKDEVIVDPTDPNRVIVKSLALLADGRPDVVLDLSKGNLEVVKKKLFTIKEGIHYKIRIDFFVQREIVTGLKYQQKIYRHGIQVEKMNQMVGSYAPKFEIQSYTSPLEEMPSGMLARGTYTVKSLFTDDDKNEHLKWEWTFELKKDWD